MVFHSPLLSVFPRGKQVQFLKYTDLFLQMNESIIERNVSHDQPFWLSIKFKCVINFTSSIEHGGTRPFSNIMAPLTLFNEAPKHKSVTPLALKNAYLWLCWPSLMRGLLDHFPICGNFCEVLPVVGGVRFWSKEQSDVARNRVMGGQRGY